MALWLYETVSNMSKFIKRIIWVPMERKTRWIYFFLVCCVCARVNSQMVMETKFTRSWSQLAFTFEIIVEFHKKQSNEFCTIVVEIITLIDTFHLPPVAKLCSFARKIHSSAYATHFNFNAITHTHRDCWTDNSILELIWMNRSIPWMQSLQYPYKHWRLLIIPKLCITALTTANFFKWHSAVTTCGQNIRIAFFLHECTGRIVLNL